MIHVIKELVRTGKGFGSHARFHDPTSGKERIVISPFTTTLFGRVSAVRLIKLTGCSNSALGWLEVNHFNQSYLTYFWIKKESDIRKRHLELCSAAVTIKNLCHMWICTLKIHKHATLLTSINSSQMCPLINILRVYVEVLSFVNY